MHVYALGPIDHWDGWMLAKGGKAPGYGPDLPEATNIDYEDFLKEALEAGRRRGWEGDFRNGPFVSVLPDPINCGSAPLVAWKQDNNGTTFIASPFPLPYLENW